MIAQINPHRVFSLEDANSLLPLVNRITRKAVSGFEKIIERQNYLYRCGRAEQAKAFEPQISELMRDWQKKMIRLGVFNPLSWRGDFDSGSGYWCWVFPEDKISYRREYWDNWQTRLKVEVNGQIQS